MEGLTGFQRKNLSYNRGQICCKTMGSFGKDAKMGAFVVDDNRDRGRAMILLGWTKNHHIEQQREGVI